MIDINTLAKKFEKNTSHNYRWEYPKNYDGESFRWIVVGRSGTGKTTMVFNTLINEMVLYWDKIYLVSSTMTQSKNRAFIELLRKTGKEVEQRIQDDVRQKVPPFSLIEVFKSTAEFIEVGGLELPDPSLKNILILDDVLTELSDPKIVRNITDMFIKSRHYGISVILLSQSYTLIPKPIRQNANIFSIFTLPKRAIYSMLYDIASDMDGDELYELFKKCTQDLHGFLHVSNQETTMDRKYRCGLQGKLF